MIRLKENVGKLFLRDCGIQIFARQIQTEKFCGENFAAALLIRGK